MFFHHHTVARLDVPTGKERRDARAGCPARRTTVPLELFVRINDNKKPLEKQRIRKSKPANGANRTLGSERKRHCLRQRIE